MLVLLLVSLLLLASLLHILPTLTDFPTGFHAASVPDAAVIRSLLLLLLRH
jgi:hypothetical protein